MNHGSPTVNTHQSAMPCSINTVDGNWAQRKLVICMQSLLELGKKGSSCSPTGNDSF